MGMTKEINQAVTEVATMSSDGSRLLKDGTIVGDWLVLALIGQGGNGEVYRVKHIKSGVIGALKAPHGNDPRQRQRFDLESEILQKIASSSRLKALHFPRFLDKGNISVSNLPYIVIEFLKKFDSPKPPEPPMKTLEVARVILEVCEALRELHKTGYLHRDIKSENLMQRDNGEIVLIDFGLGARIGDVTNPLAKRVSVTQGRMYGVGTEGSMAPEQAFGHASIRSDIYALGALAIECFQGETPAQWASIIQTAVNPKEEFRYHDIREFETAIRKWACVEKADTEKKIKLLSRKIRKIERRTSIRPTALGWIYAIVLLYTIGYIFHQGWSYDILKSKITPAAGLLIFLQSIGALFNYNKTPAAQSRLSELQEEQAKLRQELLNLEIIRG